MLHLKPLFSAALLSQLLRLLLLLLLVVLVVRVWCGYGVVVVCGDDTGARDADASRALGPKRRLHRRLGPVDCVHSKTYKES